MNSKLGEFHSMKIGNTIAKVIIVIIKEMYNNRINHTLQLFKVKSKRVSLVGKRNT